MRAADLIPKVGTGFAGETMEGATGLTKITGHLLHKEETELARTLVAMSEKQGVTVDDLLKDEKTRQILRTIVQYPSKGLASSNLSKALNLAFFPVRYNAKVTALAVKALANQPVPVQFAAVKGISDFIQFTQSDEGTKWQADNSELIGLIQYFTPINSIQSIYNAISSGNIKDLGAIGGLPFGIITRTLEGQGVIDLQSPYLDPKTGEIVPTKLPATAKGHLQQFIRDVIDTTFTFPGRRAGLPSKGSVIDMVPGLKRDKADFKEGDKKELTAEQQRTQRILQAGKKPSTPTLPGIKPATVPNVTAPNVTPIYKGGTAKAKKAKNKAVRPGQPF
jgi:hypothetical protein